MPGRTFLSWTLAYGTSRGMLRFGARRGELLARLVVEPELRRDPYPSYDRIRERGPVYKGRFISGTTSHAACNDILRSEAFGVAGGMGGMPMPVRRVLDRVAEPGVFGPMSPPSMLAVDPPEHTRYRRQVSRVFTPRAVAGLEPRVREIADDLLGEAEASGGGFDLVERYAAKLPTAVISEILGVPKEMRDQVLVWGDGAAAMLDPDLEWSRFRVAEKGAREMFGWFDDHIAYLRRHPGDNLLSRLARLDGDDRLDDDQLRATGLLVLGAGFETTVNLIGNAVELLDRHPDQLAEAMDDPALWPGVVEEVLRYESPVQLTLREAYEDTEVRGVPVRRREAVLVMLAGANRDPEVFEEPHRFDIHRPNAADHLSFSSGVHYCLGASLARIEAAAALRALYERFPRLRVTGTPVRRPTRVLRGYRRLPVGV